MKSEMKWTIGITLSLVLFALWSERNDFGRAVPPQAETQSSIEIPAGVDAVEANKALARITRALRGNKFDLSPDDLRMVSNPMGTGVFFYVEKTHFAGVKRFFVWFENKGLVSSLNGPTLTASPSLPFPRDQPSDFLTGTGHDPYRLTPFAIKFIFE